jgi:asparagine synthase (glutamine-hydrolysing)
MCGICGMFGLEDRTVLERMMDQIEHRGPDDSGVFTDRTVALGHRRLSIIDLKTGHQPLSNEDGSIWITFNGEIYNYRELRADLETRHRFVTNSDTEVIVHLYEEDPEGFVLKLDGMFALAIYDGPRGRLTLARDPLGKKPLYYRVEGEVIYFASEIKSLLATGMEPELNLDCLPTYLGYQYCLGEGTMFRGVRKLMAGHMLQFAAGSLSTRMYWDINETITGLTEAQAIAVLRSMLEGSAKKRMIADVEVGAFLSGGIDSSAIVALTRPLVDYSYHTFSLGFEGVSELPFAKMVAEHVDTEHHEIVLTADMVSKDIEKMAWHYDEPMGDPAILNNYFLSKEARRYVKVVLAGEGGDELFAGYDNYARCLQFQKIRSVPLLGRTLIGIARRFPGRGDLTKGRYEKELSMLEEEDIAYRLMRSTRELSDLEISSLLGGQVQGLESKGWYNPGAQDPLGRMLYADCRNRLPEKYLMKADKATMANSVEERLPLLDRGIAEFAFSLPAHMKLREKEEKWIMRQAVRDLLPLEIVRRKKQGFSTPVGTWLEGELGEKAASVLSSSPLLREHMGKEEMHRIVQGIERKSTGRPRAVWTLFVLGLWHDIFFK